MVGTTLTQVLGTKNISTNYSLAYTFHFLAQQPRDIRLFWTPTDHGPRKFLHPPLFPDRFSRRADMFAVTAAEFTTEGIANIWVNRFIPL